MIFSCNKYVVAFIGLMCGSKRRDSMNRRVIATIGALLIGTAVISGCGSEKPPEDTSSKYGPSPLVKNQALRVLVMQAPSIIKQKQN